MPKITNANRRSTVQMVAISAPTLDTRQRLPLLHVVERERSTAVDRLDAKERPEAVAVSKPGDVSYCRQKKRVPPGPERQRFRHAWLPMRER